MNLEQWKSMTEDQQTEFLDSAVATEIDNPWIKIIKYHHDQIKGHKKICTVDTVTEFFLNPDPDALCKHGQWSDLCEDPGCIEIALQAELELMENE